MSEQRTEFDKWFDDYEHNNDIRLAINYGAYEIAGDAWQAATAEANKRINALEGEVAELLKVNQVFSSGHIKLSNAFFKLQANNHDLREALEEIVRLPYTSIKWGTIAGKALSTTPAESLQAHDDEVLERAAKIVSENIKSLEVSKSKALDDSEICNYYENSINALEPIEEAIRALKEVK